MSADFITTLIDNGVVESIILVTMLTLLIAIELLSGIQLDVVVSIRRILRYTLIPIGFLFLLLAIVRISALI